MEWLGSALLIALVLGPGGLVFWAMVHSTKLTERLHPLTPEQRRRKRRVYAVMAPLVAASFAIAFALRSGGTARVVALAVIAAILLLDAVLTPWLHYQRARRQATPDNGFSSR
jgi:hypothetical protein